MRPATDATHCAETPADKKKMKHHCLLVCFLKSQTPSRLDAGLPDACFESLAELAASVNEEIYWLKRCVAAGRARAVDHKLKSAQKRKDAEIWFRMGLR